MDRHITLESDFPMSPEDPACGDCAVVPRSFRASDRKQFVTPKKSAAGVGATNRRPFGFVGGFVRARCDRSAGTAQATLKHDPVNYLFDWAFR